MGLCRVKISVQFFLSEYLTTRPGDFYSDLISFTSSQNTVINTAPNTQPNKKLGASTTNGNR